MIDILFVACSKIEWQPWRAFEHSPVCLSSAVEVACTSYHRMVLSEQCPPSWNTLKRSRYDSKIGLVVISIKIVPKY